MATGPTLHHVTAAREGWCEAFVTLIPAAPLATTEAVTAAYEHLATFLRDQELHVLQEKLLGHAGVDPDLDGIRTAVLGRLGLDPAVPFTRVQGTAPAGGAVAGIQIMAARLEDPAVVVRTLSDAGGAWGRLLEARDHRRLFLAGASGFDPAAPRSPSAQTKTMFSRVQRRLQAAGFEYADVVRTWIYLPELLGWYPEFNRVRTRCYRDFGVLGPESGVPLPASTGIQGLRHADEACLMDALALSLTPAQRARIRPAHNPRQNEATAYGSAFSRGMTLAFDGPATCYVSGTASIDAAGASTHPGDSQGQVVETYLNVAALLEEQGMGLDDLVQATAYCKRPEDFRVWRQVTRLLGLGDLPVVPVLADVCRHELLFELEGIAVGRSRSSIS